MGEPCVTASGKTRNEDASVCLAGQRCSHWPSQSRGWGCDRVSDARDVSGIADACAGVCRGRPSEMRLGKRADRGVGVATTVVRGWVWVPLRTERNDKSTVVFRVQPAQSE